MRKENHDNTTLEVDVLLSIKTFELVKALKETASTTFTMSESTTFFSLFFTILQVFVASPLTPHHSQVDADARINVLCAGHVFKLLATIRAALTNFAMS